MFVSSIKIKGRAEKRLEIIQTIGGIIDQVRSRKGCLCAASYEDIQDQNTFCLINEWETQQDMKEYFHSKLFSALLGIRSILAEKPEVRVLTDDNTYNCDDQNNESIQVH